MLRLVAPAPSNDPGITMTQESAQNMEAATEAICLSRFG
jgi:hypothetical protein